jgi:AraC family transcriptional regulator
MLQSFSGASVKRVIDRSHSCVPEHAHDWPVLSLFVIGSFQNETELGKQLFCGPSAIFYRAGAAHRNIIGADGFEQVEIEFDPRWLGGAWLPGDPVVQWVGGRVGAETRSLLRACRPDTCEGQLRSALQRFLGCANRQPHPEPASWVGTIMQRLREDTTLKVGQLAHEVQRHPSWTGCAYRCATGEGVQETAARFRVERAARLLRETQQSCIAIAFESGFCDQSHMNRTFRRVLGRSPVEVREDRHAFRQPAARSY